MKECDRLAVGYVLADQKKVMERARAATGKTNHMISVYDVGAEKPRGYVFIEVSGDVALSEIRQLLPSSWDNHRPESDRGSSAA